MPFGNKLSRAFSRGTNVNMATKSLEVAEIFPEEKQIRQVLGRHWKDAWSDKMLWHDFLTEYFHLDFHTIGTYQ